jgi:hypothetical protein
MTIADKLIKAANNNNKVYIKGMADGYAEGYEVGETAGKDIAYNEFWDIYQQKGKREHYSYAFAGYGWTDKTFKPKYDIVIGETISTNMFTYSEIVDLKGILKKQNVILDTSKCTDIGAMFNGCKYLLNCPPIDATNAKHCNSMFMYCNNIDGIELIIKYDGSQTFTNTFTYCNNLYSLKISGVIGESVSLKQSKYLSKQSVINVVNALSSTATGKTLTLHQEVRYWFNNTDWNNLINSKKNWTISLV